MSTAINKDVNSLDDKFKIKFISWWSEVIAKYPNARVFEARRSIERQKYLYAQWRYKPYENNKVVTWTMQSKHLEGKAVDIVFLDDKGNPTRNGPYDDLIEMAKKYGIHNLKPRETCHFEDNGKALENADNANTEKVNELDGIAPLDIACLFELQKDKLRSGEVGTLDKRMLIIVARVYKMLKK